MRSTLRLAALWAVLVAGLVAVLPASTATPAVAAPAAAFAEVTAFSGLTNPTVVRFAPDGRVFVAEKSGLVKVFDGLDDQTPTVFADLRTNVHNYWDRGLLGLALPPDFPADPYVYVLYTHDAPIGGTAPVWGNPGVTSDGCPTPPGPMEGGCVVSGRLSRLRAAGNTMTGTEQVLVEDWCQQYPSHSVGTVAFGADGMLYATGGEGASFAFADYGQGGTPANPCGDPPGGPGGAMTPPTAEGGMLRAQDARTMGDPLGLNGTVIRVDPETGAGVPGNPFFTSADANARRVVATGLRNPFRLAPRPGTDELWLTDVGWNTAEELNRLRAPVAGTAPNFGWPCYEGTARQPGYDSIDLDVCENLYREGPGAVTAPAFAYDRSAPVGAGDHCPTDGASISGIAFEPAAGAAYPAEYQGALFFSDYSRRCIWVMPRGADGQPNPADVRPFPRPSGPPVGLEFSPAGELFYPVVEAGLIKRVVYTDPDSCPVGQFRAELFAGMTPGGTPAVTRCQAAVDHDWGAGGPGGGLPDDTFSARWTGSHPFAVADTYEFTASADDGIRLWVDDRLVIDQWDDRPGTYRALVPLTAGHHPVRVEYYEHGGSAAAAVSWRPTSPQNPLCATGRFRAEYHRGTSLGGPPVLARCEDAVAHNWGLGSPGSGIPVDGFSARWSGRHSFPVPGTYEFTVVSDDGVRLWVDDRVVIDRWTDHPATTYTALVPLTAGDHTVQVEYYENGVEATANVSWATTTPSCPRGQFAAEYFDGMALGASPVVTRCEAAVAQNWGVAAPAAACPPTGSRAGGPACRRSP